MKADNDRLSAEEQPMQQPPSEKPDKRNILLVAGIWITVVTASIWVGHYVIDKIKDFLPYSLGVGIAVLSLGFFLDMKKKNAPKNPES